MRRTGHRLESDGKANEVATCQCGTTSEPIATQAGRKRWHQQHLADLPEPTCEVDGCSKARRGRRFCPAHDDLRTRNGQPERLPHEVHRSRALAGVPVVLPSDAQVSFWRQVTRGSGCWQWTGCVGSDGYGQVSAPARTRLRAHRVAYELEVGPIEVGLTLDHLCKNRLCVNPTHLEPVTRAENSRRESDRNTTCRQGHPKTPENRYVRPDGLGTHCRPCIQIRSKRQYEREKALRG
jgi:hypothetical protein